MRNIVLTVLLLAAVPLFAQRYDDTITVNVVDVPVYVERFGKPITGLTRDDFELFVGGKPHPIEYFDVLDEGAAEPVQDGTSVPPDLRARRLIMLLFDLAGPGHSLQRARVAAAKYVGEGAPGDTFAVATIGRSGIRFLVPFTSDRVAVQRAIRTLRPSAARDPFRVATLSSERVFWGRPLGGSETASASLGDIWGHGLPGTFAPQGRGALPAVSDLEAVESEMANRHFIDTLSALADRLAPLEGVKHVVLLTHGSIENEGPVLPAVTRMHKRYRTAGVILNAVDLRPPRTPDSPALSSEPDGAFRTRSILTSDFLWALALDTGGIATSSLPQLQARNRVAYRIGFHPPSGKRSNSIRVRVKKASFLTDVRYRKSYSLGEPAGDVSLFLADTLLNDIPQNGVTLDLSVQEHGVAASIPGVELLSYAAAEPLHLDVYFYIFDRQQQTVAWQYKGIAVDLEKGRDFLSAHPYTVEQEFDLQPGRYVAKALVRIAGTDRVGFERAELEVVK